MHRCEPCLRLLPPDVTGMHRLGSFQPFTECNVQVIWSNRHHGLTTSVSITINTRTRVAFSNCWEPLSFNVNTSMQNLFIRAGWITFCSPAVKTHHCTNFLNISSPYYCLCRCDGGDHRRAEDKEWGHWILIRGLQIQLLYIFTIVYSSPLPPETTISLFLMMFKIFFCSILPILMKWGEKCRESD